VTTYYQFHDSPLGTLLLVGNGEVVTGVHVAAGKYVPGVGPDWVCDSGQAVLVRLRRELDAYFSGRLRSFSVALEPQGTEFQKRVWAALARIPFGETRTYGQQARAIGQPSAARAVGAANGRNPIGIVLPCHRVIGANGELTGYAGGLEAKGFLLKLESGA
jgi:methylated-DNA-[protein]-cysteine S-methyltransferase